MVKHLSKLTPTPVHAAPLPPILSYLDQLLQAYEHRGGSRETRKGSSRTLSLMLLLLISKSIRSNLRASIGCHVSVQLSSAHGYYDGLYATYSKWQPSPLVTYTCNNRPEK